MDALRSAVVQREPLLRLMARVGVGHFRDFPQMGLLRPNASVPPGQLLWDALGPMSGAMGQLHNLSVRYGLRQLDEFSGATGWNDAHLTTRGCGAVGQAACHSWDLPRDVAVEADNFAAVGHRVK